MIIQRIRIKNFKSIYEEFILDFNNIKGLWKISGNVGTGKTSIGEALIYGLFGAIGGKNVMDLISWGRKHGEIEIWCISKGKSIHIKRELNSYGQSPIWIYVDGEELFFSNKREAQSALENEYYDVSRTTIELLCIISFNNFKSLTTLNSADTKKFIDYVLGFQILSKYNDICKEFIDEHKRNTAYDEEEIKKIEAQCNKIKEISGIDILYIDIEEVLNQISCIDKNLKDLQRQYDIDIKQDIDKKNDLEEKKTTISTLGKNKKTEINLIKNGKCPICGNIIDDSLITQKKLELNDLSFQYVYINEELQKVKESLKKTQEIFTSSQNDLKKKLDGLKNKKTIYEEQSKRLQINENEVKVLEGRIQSIRDALQLKYNEIDSWKELSDILCGIKANVLQSFIPLLNNNIQIYTNLLKLQYQVIFDNNLTCYIKNIYSSDIIPISSLSTGQLKIVDMVVILGALGTLIGSRGINILFLDELFSNLDMEYRSIMCYILKNFIKDDMTIFIISHTDLEDSYFEGNINISTRIYKNYENHSDISIYHYK